MKRKWLLLVVGLVLVLAVAGFTGCKATGGVELKELPSGLQLNLNSQQQGIWVTGQGKVTVISDLANLSLGISAQAASVAEAQSQAVEAMDRVMTALTDNDVAKKDIQAQQFSISQVTRWDREKEEEIVIGYRVSHMVIAKIRNIDIDKDKVGPIIDAVAEAGGDFTRINNISFSVDEPSDYYEEAREKAMEDAQAKAKQLAELAGVTLGKPTYVSESTYTPPSPRPVVLYEMEAPPGMPATQISVGETEINLTVQVVYAIQ